MPEATFTVRWPDGTVDPCASPSLVVWDHLAVGAEYPVDEFVRRSVAALTEAGQRVRARYGFTCTAALAEAERIRAVGAAHDAAAPVQVLAIVPPLPGRG